MNRDLHLQYSQKPEVDSSIAVIAFTTPHESPSDFFLVLISNIFIHADLEKARTFRLFKLKLSN